MDDPEKVDPVTLLMGVYKASIKSDIIIDKLKLIIIVKGYLHNKEMIGDTWDPTVSIRTLKYFLSDSAKHKARVHQLDFVGAFLQSSVKPRVLKVGNYIWRIIPRVFQLF